MWLVEWPTAENTLTRPATGPTALLETERVPREASGRHVPLPATTNWTTW